MTSTSKQQTNDTHDSTTLTWSRVFSHLLFPFSNIFIALFHANTRKSTSEGKEQKHPKARVVPDSPGYVSPFDIKSNLIVIFGIFKSVLLATFILSSPLLWPVDQASMGGYWWILLVLARDVGLSILVCCTWDYMLYFSPLQETFAPYKLNPNFPPKAQFVHDFWNTCIASCCAGLIECRVLYAIATGQYQYSPLPSIQGLLSGNEGDLSLLLTPNFLWTMLTIIFTTHWRLPHFYLIHRGSHPWGWKLFGTVDVGKVMYQNVHKLHHRSRNPTAFSGISMHPVEAILYFSAALLPLLLNLHPITFLVCKLDLSLGAQYGHDGFQYPGSASYVHWLHHHYFECNYSENIVFSLDHVFGSFYDGSIPWSDFCIKSKTGKSSLSSSSISSTMTTTEVFERPDDDFVEGRSKFNGSVK